MQRMIEPKKCPHCGRWACPYTTSGHPGKPEDTRAECEAEQHRLATRDLLAEQVCDLLVSDPDFTRVFLEKMHANPRFLEILSRAKR